MGGFTILMQCAFSRAQGCARLKQANDERIILADRPRGSAPEDESGCHRDIIGSSANAADCPPLWLGLSIDESAFEHRYARVSTLETAPARAQDAATNAPFFIVGSGALVYGIKQVRKSPRGKYYFDYTLLKLPILGLLLRKIAVARFTRTLGTLITSGVPILEGLAITAKTSGNAVLEEALMRVRKAIEEGRTIVDPLKECGVFPNMVTQMIGVGEATGAMDSMLQKIADFYEDEVDAATRDMLAMLEPAIIGILGVTIGGIVISLYMPLFSMIAKLAG